MPKLIFKRLHEETLAVRNRLQSPLFVTEEVKRLEDKRHSALMEIVDYAREANFLSHASGKEKLRYFFKSHFNYKQTAAHFNCPQNNIESAISYAGKQFEKRIGSNTVRMIVQAQTQEALDGAMLQFHVGVNPLGSQSLFLFDLRKQFPAPVKMGYQVLDEFLHELKLLRIVSLRYIEKVLADVDHKRLSHLLYILQSTDSELVKERQVLHRMLQGEYSDWDEAWKAWTSLQEENLFISPDEPSPVQL